jgi:hypothetical protein
MMFSDGADLGSTITAILESRACRSAAVSQTSAVSDGGRSLKSSPVPVTAVPFPGPTANTGHVTRSGDVA